jgi:hypothetical protein
LSKTNNPVGRPKKIRDGQAKLPEKPRTMKSIMVSYQRRLLNSPSSQKVIGKVFEVALADGHPHQAACMKMILDRVAPTTGFSELAASGPQRQAIQINITSVGSPEIKDVTQRAPETLDQEEDEDLGE